ncbi:hypothetical protein TCAL_16409 [Tigriopus californicus]|uniref:non-specific serine/threonine protein kinase n=1 Tax=Tigriopus californicus TaxID=6832 RepID=A0A553NYA3_TIGCA|nr:membrane-associated tyrosine- and threonine-specific cdc2-inhibitory kinase-like [Tigriopus californicus]TRY70416.1 hypothetical protein TCAL_16409 [Tigriopus californicus]|eukprot:TCALIF_01255-PB protein Name:"Similar to Pkmyt1 Membrane-associated tyrosine- and threonine-specific cdc2-inhibitory kinase (Mus musculus)" AED:0.26 eAED:0.26 QI:70/1/1/1/1/1/8/128/664
MISSQKRPLMMHHHSTTLPTCLPPASPTQAADGSSPRATPTRLTQSFSLPKPNFKDHPQTFSTKKSRATPRFRPPPRPPAKTCPPVSRVFSRRIPHLERAQSVTFKDRPNGSMTPTPIGTPLLASPVYDDSIGQSYFEQAFTVEKEIGEGHFGKVYRVRSKEDGRLYAVKIAQECYKGDNDRARKLEEVRKHEFLLHHPNCVRFYQSWEEGGRLYQQFELCEMSLDELSEEKHDLPEKLIWGYLVDLLLALKHLHDHNLIHMDVKPENIFIGRDGICKLGDFGLVLDLSKDDLTFQHNYGGGDSKYMANEVLSHMYTPAADIFSLGLTILELACDLELPNNGPLWHELRDTGPSPEITGQLSPELRRVIQLMSARDPIRRPTVGQLLALPCIREAKLARQRELQWNNAVLTVRRWCSPLMRICFMMIALICWPVSEVGKSIFNHFGIHIGAKESTEEGDTPNEGSNDNVDPCDDHTPPSIPNRSFNATKLTFSSDDEEGQNNSLSSSTHSVLACPLPPSDFSPLRTRDEKVFHDGNVPSPIPSPRPTFSSVPTRQVQSTPSGLKSRSRRSAAKKCGSAVKSPNKKLDFSQLGHMEGANGPAVTPDTRSVLSSKCEERGDVDDDDHDGLNIGHGNKSINDSNVKTKTLKPASLASKFDYFSDSDS